MLNVQRCNLILKLINKNKNIKLTEIVDKLNVSEATVRRDLNLLEEKGKIKRVHGGAVLMDVAEEDIIFKKSIFSNEKNKIAKIAASFVKDGDKVYLDAGTTTGAMISYLAHKENITVITNGLSHLEELNKHKIQTYLIGGRIKGTTAAIVGGSAVLSLKNYSYDIAFVGANGVNEDGYSTPDEEEAAVKSTVVGNCSRVYFLCDSSKFFKKSFMNFARLEDGVLISEAKIPEELIKKRLNKNNQ
ncbi:MAG: DeoR/GlpR family DNA-binding transcription regulator [Fusobacteriaceae bacterium]|jgi:DeoR family fructose operon transcriptional repressor|nr:DeoR/GlpR family DNA-binding transcription regulator [Fusobacteriaceae bacterium]